MAEEKKPTNFQSYLKFKYENLEFEIKGSEPLIERIFLQITDIISLEPNLEDIEELEQELHNPEIKEIQENELPDIDSINSDTPLDKYLEQYDTTKPQKKTLAICLYLLDILKRDKFRSRDINKVLIDNKFSPIQSITTHIMRLRNKGLISIVGKQGEKEAVLTIYKDSIEKVKDYLKNP